MQQNEYSQFYVKYSFMNFVFVLTACCLFPLVCCLASLSASHNHPADSVHAHLDALAM